MSTLKCQQSIPQLKDWELKELTVGHVFELNCEGELPKLDPASLELRTGVEDVYVLKLVQFTAVSDSLAQLRVASYRVGQHHLQAVQLVDKENSVLLGDLQFTVASVQNPQEPAKEPLPPMGPFYLQLSWIYWAFLASVVLVIAGGFLWRWKRRRERKRLLDELHLNETAATAYNEFYRNMRHIQRSYHFVDQQSTESEKIQKAVAEIEECFRRYISRHFQTPALKWGDAATLRDIRRHHPHYYKGEGSALKKVFLEFSRAKKAKAPSPKDVQQLLQIAKDEIEKLESRQVQAP